MTTPAPPEATASAAKRPLRLHKPGSATPEAVLEIEPPPIPVRDPAAAGRRKAKPRRISLGDAGRIYQASWLWFLLLGGFMAAVRYGAFLGLYSQYKSEFLLYGPYAVLALHAVATFLAFTDDLFAGVLCLLVPGYSLYFLLSRSGRPFIVATTFGLLAGLGEDAFAEASRLSIHAYDAIAKLMAGG